MFAESFLQFFGLLDVREASCFGGATRGGEFESGLTPFFFALFLFSFLAIPPSLFYKLLLWLRLVAINEFSLIQVID